MNTQYEYVPCNELQVPGSVKLLRWKLIKLPHSLGSRNYENWKGAAASKSRAINTNSEPICVVCARAVRDAAQGVWRAK